MTPVSVFTGRDSVASCSGDLHSSAQRETKERRAMDDGDEPKRLESKPSSRHEPMPPPDWEIALYLTSFVISFVYAAWDFYLACCKHPSLELRSHYMQPGWLSDWMEYPPVSMGQHMLHGYRFLIASSTGFVMVSQVTLRWTSSTPHFLAIAGYTLAVTAAVVNARSAVYMLVLHAAAVCMAYYSLAGVWMLVLAAMMLQNSRYQFTLSSFLHLPRTGPDFHFPIIGYLYCRSISAGHSLNRMLQHQRMHGPEAPTFVQFLLHHLPKSLAYGFYLPWHYVGPILTYDEFCDEVSRSDRNAWDLRSAAILIWRACRLLLWLLVLQAIHHFLPVGAFLQSIDSGNQVTYIRLSFAMYLHGQNFMLAYVQLYGWSGLVARIDGVRLPHWPDCISRVYTYRKMWRVFDRGLASIMQHHIYVPIGGSRHGLIRQVAAVTACFAFVSVYHGDTWGVRAWSALNAAQLLMEAAACGIYRTRVKNWLSWHLSQRNHQRVTAFVIGCNLLLTSCFIFFFLVESTAFSFITEIFKPLLLQRPLWHLLLLLYLSYCSVQVSLRYERRHVECQKGKRL